jgi:hypothetical protein
MNSDRRLDRVERLLLSCIKADDRERRERRKQLREQPDEAAARRDEWLRQQRIAQRKEGNSST